MTHATPRRARLQALTVARRGRETSPAKGALELNLDRLATVLGLTQSGQGDSVGDSVDTRPVWTEPSASECWRERAALVASAIGARGPTLACDVASVLCLALGVGAELDALQALAAAEDMGLVRLGRKTGCWKRVNETRATRTSPESLGNQAGRPAPPGLTV
jgi:hypothetical protein